MNCPACHVPNEADARFCKNCGAALSPGQAGPVRRPLLLWVFIGAGLLVVVAVALALFWLFSRPGQPNDFVTIDPSIGITLPLGAGAELTLPPEGLSGPLRLKASAISTDQLPAENPEAETGLTAAVVQLPPYLSLQSAVYRFEVEGPPPTDVLLNLPGPATADIRALDLYAWDGKTWSWQPCRLEASSGRFMARLKSLPPAVALLRREPEEPIIMADLAPEMTLPAEAQGVLTEILLTGFTLQEDGRVKTEPGVAEIKTTARLIPSLRNWRADGSLTSAVGDILADPARRQRQLEAILGLALAGGYPAVQLDYHLDANQREAFSTFVTELAGILHGQKRTLIIRVEAPVQVSATDWETGAFDWIALSQAADRLQVPLATDPALPTQAQAEVLLDWAVGQVERSKLQPIIPWGNVSPTAGIARITAAEALAQLGPLQLSPESDSLQPEDSVILSLAGLAGGVPKVDPASGLLHWIGPDQAGKSNHFYFQTNASRSRWLGRLAGYHLAGVLLEDFLAESQDEQSWKLLQTYRALDVSALESEPVWVWTVSDMSSSTILSQETRSLAQPAYTWTAPNAPGKYRAEVALAINDQEIVIPIADLALQIEPAPVATSTGDSLANANQQVDTLKLDTPPPSPTLTATPIPTPSATPTPTPKPASPAPPPPPRRAYQLAYAVWDGQFYNLYIADTQNNTTQLLFTRAAGPSWSPDKKRLFFIGQQGVTQQIRENRTACEFGTISDGMVAVDLPSPLRDICQVQPGPWFCERKGVDLQAEPSDVCTANGISVYQNLDWKEGTARWASTAPNGDAVAFDAKPGQDLRIYFRAMLGTSQQFRFEIPGEQGSWSPDGQRMVYRSGRDNKAGLWISNRDDSNATLITNDGSDAFPTWSADGRTIAFSRTVNGNTDIYLINVDGSNLQRLTDAPGHDTLPVYTPAGDIIFRSDRSGSWSIWRMSGNGRNQEELIPNAGLGPDWAFGRMDVK